MRNLFETECSRHYISLLQENINRMASNCTSCKTWLVSIVSVLFALQVANDELKNYLWLAVIPTVLLFILDAYYLGQEKRFRDLENNFVQKEKANENTDELLYSFNSAKGSGWKYFWKGV